jgi:hypothetical protein
MKYVVTVHETHIYEYVVDVPSSLLSPEARAHAKDLALVRYGNSKERIPEDITVEANACELYQSAEGEDYDYN